MQIIGDKDPEIWRLAKRRASFKRHLFSYIVINGMLWCIWAFGHNWWHDGINIHFGIPWPAWYPSFGA